MSYKSALAQLVLDHRTEIEADLAAARVDFDEAQEAINDASSRIHALEALLASDTAASAESTVGGGSDTYAKMTLHAAMQRVLRAAPTGKLRATEIIAEIERLKLYRMRDGRLPESQQIHARANHYPEMFGKDGSHFFAK